MESLKTLFQAKASFVKDSANAGNPPTNEQLANFLRNLTTETGRAVRHAHPEVREALRVKFSEAGWDVGTNRATKDEPPTLDELYTFLDETVDVLESFDPPIEPTEEELDDISAACDRLWDLDSNRLTPEVEYSINLQQGKTPYAQGDRAADPLFTRVDSHVLERPSFAAFLRLLDNYTSSVGESEVVTGEEMEETKTFIEAVMATPCMRYAHKYLVAKGEAPESDTAFKNLLYKTWFSLYSRARGVPDSSGFEHAFVGESKRGKITGLHNWIQMYNEERSGRLDYRGYILPRHRGYEDEPDESEQLITVQFEWNGELKDISSSFIGVSPEFELSLYTMLFLLDKEKNTVKLGPYMVEVTTYIMRQDGGKYIGSAFPAEA